ncbi:MAG TPA: SDR family oxidoreductase [Burkholderiales bacterium]|nr:SDR family oxidoreductase [Burkholderiales bacterium]
MGSVPNFRLDGKTAFVTGAGRGIGRACAAALAEAGAEVWLAARTRGEIESAAAQIPNAHAVVCDVTDSSQLRKAIAALPALDVFVNNAGTNIPEPFVEVTDEHLDSLLNLNVRAAFIAAQAAAKKMIEGKRRGAIINMSSQMGHVGAVNRSVYCLTKHALEGLTKAMALELALHGIRVVSVAPTFIETPMYQKMKSAKPEFAQWVEQRIPLGATGKPEDVAAAVVFAASPAAALVTGTSLVVDGGWTAQ